MNVLWISSYVWLFYSELFFWQNSLIRDSCKEKFVLPCRAKLNILDTFYEYPKYLS